MSSKVFFFVLPLFGLEIKWGILLVSVLSYIFLIKSPIQVSFQTLKIILTSSFASMHDFRCNDNKKNINL